MLYEWEVRGREVYTTVQNDHYDSMPMFNIEDDGVYPTVHNDRYTYGLPAFELRGLKAYPTLHNDHDAYGMPAFELLNPEDDPSLTEIVAGAATIIGLVYGAGALSRLRTRWKQRSREPHQARPAPPPSEPPPPFVQPPPTPAPSPLPVPPPTSPAWPPPIRGPQYSYDQVRPVVRRPSTRWWQSSRFWFFALPWVTGGLASWVPPLWAAGKVHDPQLKARLHLAAAAAGVLAVVGAVLVGVAPEDATGSLTGPRADLGAVTLLSAIGICTCAGLICRTRVFETG